MKLTILSLSATLIGSTFCAAKPARPNELTTASELQVGEQGIVWYTTWDTAKAEAKRTNKPMFFMAAAHQCSSISGTF